MATLISCAGSTVRHWTDQGQKFQCTWEKEVSGDVKDLAWSEGTGGVSCSDGTFTVFSNTGKTQHCSSASKAGLNTISFSKSSNVLFACVAGEDKNLQVWDVRRNLHLLKRRGHEVAITSARFAPSGQHIAAAGEDGMVLLHPVEEKPKAPIVFSGPSAARVAGVTSLRYPSARKDSSALATAHVDGSVMLWDAVAGTCVKAFAEQHQGPASAAEFSPVSGQYLLSAGEDRHVNIYDTGAAKPLVLRFDAGTPLTCASFHPNGRLVALGGRDGRIVLVDIRRSKAPFGTIAAHPGQPLAALECLYNSYGESGAASLSDGSVPASPASESRNAGGDASATSSAGSQSARRSRPAASTAATAAAGYEPIAAVSGHAARGALPAAHITARRLSEAATGASAAAARPSPEMAPEEQHGVGTASTVDQIISSSSRDAISPIPSPRQQQRSSYLAAETRRTLSARGPSPRQRSPSPPGRRSSTATAASSGSGSGSGSAGAALIGAGSRRASESAAVAAAAGHSGGGGGGAVQWKARAAPAQAAAVARRPASNGLQLAGATSAAASAESSMPPPPPLIVGAGKGAASRLPEAALDEALRRALREEMASLRTDMHRATQNLHLDMLRQFQAQQDDMAALVEGLRHISRENAVLRAEVEALRRGV